jgi:hypothetical protein
MTAAAEDCRAPREPAGRDRRVARGWLVAVLTAASIACGSACTADPVRAGDAGRPALVNAASSGVPAADEEAIRGTIEELNSAAGGGVREQQETLAALVEPALAQALDDCAPATTTLRFEPVYPGLRAAPGWTGSSGSLTGTTYALPTLIRIYTGDRITGTDLTTVHLGVQAGEAYLTPLCVG